MSGWFAVKHGITKHPLLRGKPERIAIWIWLVDNAAWSDTKQDIDGKVVTVKRGQVAVSQRRLAEEVGVGRQVIRTFLDKLTQENMVNPSLTHGKTVLTICNYEKYQSFENGVNPAPNPVLTQHQPSTNPQKNNNNKNNNIGGENSPRANAPIDPEKVMFDAGIDLLVRAGMTERNARSFLGAKKRDFGPEAVMAAIGAATRAGAVEPVAFIQKVLAKKPAASGANQNAGAFGILKEVG